MADKDDDVHIAIPPRAFWLLIIAVLFGGTGIGSIIGPSADKQALQQCYDNSSTALAVAAQHGEEFNKLRQEDDRLRSEVNDVHREVVEGTVDRYTGTDARRDKERHEAEHKALERRVSALEKTLDRHSHENRP